MKMIAIVDGVVSSSSTGRLMTTVVLLLLLEAQIMQFMLAAALLTLHIPPLSLGTQPIVSPELTGLIRH